MSSTIEIRRAEPDDAAEIVRVLHAAFVEFEPLYTPQGFAATVLDAEQVLRRMTEGPAWIALLGDEVVGSVAAIEKNESVYVRGMAVVPAARGSGAGGRLLASAEAWALERKHTRIYLSTTPFLLSAIRLYEGNGYKRVDTKLHDLFGTPLFTMEKSLPTK